MSDCIDRNEVIKIINSAFFCHMDHKAIILKRIEQLPIIDPKQKTAHWLNDLGNQKCSNCETVYPDLYPDYFGTAYCPHCGAKMQEVDNET